MSTVLFVCLHNAGRSQMSQARFTRAAGGRHAALSAGTTPAEHVHPEVVQAMRELDIDLRKPRFLTQQLAGQADIAVTMGWGDQCPFIPGKRCSTGTYPTPKASRSTRSASSETKSPTASPSSSPTSTRFPTSRLQPDLPDQDGASLGPLFWLRMSRTRACVQRAAGIGQRDFE
jgi:arsenate reductase (thioredoxin)